MNSGAPTQIEELFLIEQDFAAAIEALTAQECRFNVKLRRKTQKVATLLRHVAHLRRKAQRQTGPCPSNAREAQ